jgi:hypothetical protein
MRLILSSHNPRNTLYSTEAGQVLYKADKSGSRVTSLRKAVGHESFALYAEVEFHTFRSTHFRFGNVDVSVDEFFHKEGWFNPKCVFQFKYSELVYSAHDISYLRWVFRAADGREYYWKLDGRYLEVRMGESKIRFKMYFKFIFFRCSEKMEVNSESSSFESASVHSFPSLQAVLLHSRWTIPVRPYLTTSSRRSYTVSVSERADRAAEEPVLVLVHPHRVVRVAEALMKFVV